MHPTNTPRSLNNGQRSRQYTRAAASVKSSGERSGNSPARMEEAIASLRRDVEALNARVARISAASANAELRSLADDISAQAEAFTHLTADVIWMVG